MTLSGGGGGGGGGYNETSNKNDVNFSKIVWRRPLTAILKMSAGGGGGGGNR